MISVWLWGQDVDKYFHSVERKQICHPRILYPEKLSFKNEGKTEVFSKHNAKKTLLQRTFTTTNLKAALQGEGK